MHELVKMIGDAVRVYPKPCVNISGGIDSTIILHHLTEKAIDPIYTYTVGFPDQETEFEPARRVAEHYGTIHKEIYISKLLDRYPHILHFFDQPRFNLWPNWLAEQAYRDNRETCYIGEGGDEHFGGYWYKPEKNYMEYWSGFFTYVYPTYQRVYEYYSIRLIMPLHPKNLSFQKTLPYWDENHQKKHLRAAYKGILPNFVLKRQKHNGRFSYWKLWEQELQTFYPSATPQSEDDIRVLLNDWVTREWIKTR